MRQTTPVHDVDQPALANIRIWAPLVRQPNGYSCGVTALQSVLQYYGVSVRFDALSAALGANPEQGVNYHHIAAYAEACGIDVSIFTEMHLATLCELIDAGVPVIVALQAWADISSGAYADAWNDGHYAVVIGYDKNRFYFMDPSTLGNYTYMPTPEFLVRWHDCYEEAGKTIYLHRFGMAFRGSKVGFAPERIIRMR